MNPYYPNQPGSYYQPNQQYPHPNFQQQHYPQPQYSQTGSFYGQGQWGQPNQQPQQYPQPPQPWSNQGRQYEPFHPQAGMAPNYAGAPSFQGQPGPLAQSPFGQVQQMPYGSFPNFPAVQPPGYPPTQFSTVPSFVSPTYPYAPLQSYTAQIPTPQYTPPVATPSYPILHASATPQPSSSAISNPTPAPLTETVEVKKIDEDALESYIDYFCRTVSNDSDYSELSKSVTNFLDWIDERCKGNNGDYDHKKAESYTSAIIHKIYSQQGEQPERRVCELIAQTNIHKLSMDHFMAYVSAEKAFTEDEAIVARLDHAIKVFSNHCNTIEEILSLSSIMSDPYTNDEMIIDFIQRNSNIIKDASSDALIDLLKTDTIDQYSYILEKIQSNPKQYLEKHIDDLINSQHNELSYAEALSKLQLTSDIPQETVEKLLAFLEDYGLTQQKLVETNPTFLHFVDTDQKLQGLNAFWDKPKTSWQDVLKISSSVLKSDDEKDAFTRHILGSNKFSKLAPTAQTQLVQSLTFKSKTLKDFYLNKIILAKDRQKVPLTWPTLKKIETAVRSSEAGFTIQDGIESLTFIKDNLAHTSKELAYWSVGKDYDFLKSNEIVIRQGQTSKKDEDGNKTTTKLGDVGLFVRTMSGSDDSYINQDKIKLGSQRMREAQPFCNAYLNTVALLQNKNKDISDKQLKANNQKKLDALQDIINLFDIKEREEFVQLTGIEISI